MIASVAIVVASLLAHELAHAWTADTLGDPTPRRKGRLTLNPLAHVDPLLSLCLPVVVLLVSGGTIAFGSTKPMPLNPRWLSRESYALVVAAGPMTNLCLAAICWGAQWDLAAKINLALAIVNLLPIPPLDGWRLWKTAVRT